MPRNYNYNWVDFSGPSGLRNIGQRDDVQAATKDVWALCHPEERSHGMAQIDGESEFLTRHDDHQLVYNEQTGTVFDTVTSDYEVINPHEFIDPLVDELVERERGDVYGSIAVRDDGGAAYGQILFEDTGSIYLPGRGRADPVQVGFEVRWSHDSGMSVDVQGYAQDTSCSNSIREITSPIKVKHSGDVKNRVDWEEEWGNVLDELGAFSEALSGIIEEALSLRMWDLKEEQSEEVFPELWLQQTDPLEVLGAITPPGPLTDRDVEGFHAFYELLGFPRYLATSMAEELCTELREQDDPRIVTVWSAFSAATYALTHEYQGAQTNAGDKFRTANEILLNPELAKSQAGDEADSRATPDEAEGMPNWDGEGRDVADTPGEALRQYSEQSRQLQETFGGD